MAAKVHFQLPLDSSSSTSLQDQICRQLSTAIMNGQIPKDAPLPSSRRLATNLGISRKTVVLAYERLVDDGYLITKERSGYYVNRNILRQEVGSQEAQDTESSVQINWNDYLRRKTSHLKSITKIAHWHKFEYPFTYGQFDPSLFPTAQWRECCRDSIVSSVIRLWASDNILDDPFLLEQIRAYILPRRGIWAKPEEILITLGAQHGLYLLLQLLLDTQSTIGIEDPGYVDLRNIAAASGIKIQLLPVDDYGLVTGREIENCDCVCVTPSHQFPTTVTLPLARRKELLDLADRKRIVLIEDDYESENNFRSHPTPALKSMDKNGRVIFVGSFSKTLAPGIRMGFMVASKDLIEEARSLRRLMVRNVPQNNQRALALFIARGYYSALVQKQNNLYQERWRVMGEALNAYLPESTKPPTFGGTAYWVRGPENLNANALADAAKLKDILIEPGDVYFGGSDPPKNYFRLGYSSIDVDRIRPGIKLLSELMQGMR